MLTEPTFIEKMLNVTVESDDQQGITAFGIATGGRPKTLQRCLESYLKNFSDYENQVHSLIIDDSQEPQVCHEYRQRLRKVKEKFDCDLTYAGPQELQRYMTDLHLEGDIPKSVIEFALSKPSGLSLHHSGNRNTLLLASVDELIFISDDDTLCQTTTSPNNSPGLGLISGADPSEYWFCPSPTQLLDEPIDILASLETLLGRNPASIAKDYGGKNQICACHVSSQLRSRLTEPNAKVTLAFPGLSGDCGWGPPFGYWGEPMGFLLLNASSHARLTESEEKFRLCCTSREILRVTPTPFLSDASFSMTTFLGMDNRELLPPHFPLGRATDVVFGWTTWQGLPQSLVGHAPWTLTHAPTEQRQFSNGELSRSASAFDFGKVLFACMETFQWSVVNNDPAQRLIQLGAFLMDIGQLPADAFNEFMGVAAVKYNSRFITIIEERLNAAHSKPDYWAHELEQYLSLLRKSQLQEDYWVPLDLAIVTSLSIAKELTPKYLYQFGELLQWWPAIRDTARTLKRHGRNIGVAV